MSLPARSLEITASQRGELEHVVASSGVRKQVQQRARLVLGLAAGRSAREVAGELGMSGKAVLMWARRFNHSGTAGLYDARVRGRKQASAVMPLAAVARPANVPRAGQGMKHGGGLMRVMVSGFISVAVITLLAKGVSFFKDAAVAYRFGVSDPLDAFLLAFGVHTFASGLLIGGLPDAFVPVYARLSHRRGKARAYRFGVQATLWHGLSLLAAGGLIVGFAPSLVGIMGAGFSPEKKALAEELLPGLIPFMLCYGMSGLLSMWLRAEKTFALAAVAPILTPAVILLTLIMAGEPSAELLVWSTNWGCFLHLVVLVVALAIRFPRSRRWALGCATRWEPANRALLGNSLPFFIAGSIHGCSPQVDTAMAGMLAAGSVSVLNCSDKICGIVLALTATAASETLFPYFADSVARRDWHGIRRQLLHSTGMILAIALPVVGFLIWQAEWVVGTLFERGRFLHTDTLRVAGVVRFAALQIPFYIAGTIMSKVVVSLQATRFTLVLSVGTVVLNVVFNLLLMRSMGVAGIALSTAVVHLCSATALYLYLDRGIKRRIAESGEEGRAG